MGAPKITIRREPPDVRPVAGLSTTVWYVACVTERGPVGVPTLVTGYGEYRRIFGDLLDDPYWGPLSLSRAFKGRGAKRFWINRIVHFTDPDDVTTAISAAATFDVQDIVPASTLTVDASSDGAWANGATGGIDIQCATPATDGSATEFDLIVRYDDHQVERWNNLKKGTANVDDPQYCETVVNGNSNYVTLTDVAANASMPDTTEHPLAGGDDGLTGLVDADFIGLVGLDTALESITDAVMNLWFPDRTAVATIKTIIDFCEAHRYFLVFDPIVSNDPTTYVAALSGASLIGYSELATVCYPWVKIGNPDKSVFGQAEQITVPPSGGVVAAAITQDSKPGGVHEAPCGLENGLQSDVVGLEYDSVNQYSVRDFLCSNHINVIHKSKSGMYYLDNTDTLKVTDSFPSIGESRGVLYIEKVLDANLEWITNKNITSKIYRQIEAQIRLFLLGEMYNGAFYYDNDADKAFSIDIGSALNPASERYKGKINIHIAVAKATPVKEVDIVISKDVREVMAEVFGS